ncbi:SpoIIE family protein phosphatase [Kitasatospora sp. NPDC087314]|uniref:SpoIIE family protein phosphatase n=1 Tax=Kitasatospora sp. NPDC087314 TaxID=3364068 RepID=UPI0038282341
MPRQPSITDRAPGPGVFTAQARPLKDGTVLELHGELDLDSAGELHTTLDTVLAAAPITVIVLGCACLEFCDSTGLNAMLRAQNRAAAKGSWIELARARPLVLRMLGLPPGADPVPPAQLARHTHPDDEPAIRRLLDTISHWHRTASAVFRLLRPDGTSRHTRVIAEPVLDDDGRLTAVRGAHHDVSAQHRTEIALGATRERLADSEQKTAESEQLALRLQQAILPAAPPPLGTTGLHAAVRYRPAAQRNRVGGDWYDVLPLPDKRVLLAVGDVAGHGVGAATGMVALRHALRGLAVTGAGPAQLLEWVNTVALREPGQVTATAVCALLEPAGGGLRWARAGHLPPILLGPDGAEVLPLPHGVLLGALEEARYEEHTAHLPPGDVLLLYTDGLVERRDRPVEESVDQLIRAAGAPGPDLERYLDRLLELSPADTEDDICLIAVRVE